MVFFVAMLDIPGETPYNIDEERTTHAVASLG